MIKSSKKKSKTSSETKINQALIENFVALQKVMTNLSLKFDNLTEQISKLLNLFEISAKTLAEKEFDAEKGKKDDKKIAEKLDGLLEQNKILARGITLLHGVREETEEMPPSPQPRNQIPNPQTAKIPEYGVDLRGYEKSISSGQKNFSQEI